MRKILSVFVPALVLLLAAVPLAAQDAAGTLAHVTFWSVDDVAGFEAGLVAHNAFHVAQKDPSALFTWQVISGERNGQYVRASFGHTWADFDTEEKMAPADDADSAVHLTPYITHSDPGTYRFIPEISRPAAGEPTPLARILVFHVKFGKSRQFEGAVAKIHAALNDVEDWGNYLWYELVEGGPVPTYVLSLPSANWVGFTPHEPGFAAIVGKKYGDQAAAILAALDDAVESEDSYTIAYRKDLSYIPSAGTM